MLKDQRAVVVGGTSGIGLATAIELSRSGAQVWLTGRTPEKTTAAAASIGDRVSAAKLAVILAGESPANRGGPVAVVVISSNGKGDRPVESLEVKAPGGRPEYRSDPYRGASNLAGRSECAN